MELIKGKRWTFCQHYPDGYCEPFECAECAIIRKMLPVYYVTSVESDSIVLSADGTTPYEITAVGKSE